MNATLELELIEARRHLEWLRCHGSPEVRRLAGVAFEAVVRAQTPERPRRSLRLVRGGYESSGPR